MRLDTNLIFHQLLEVRLMKCWTPVVFVSVRCIMAICVVTNPLVHYILCLSSAC